MRVKLSHTEQDGVFFILVAQCGTTENDPPGHSAGQRSSTFKNITIKIEEIIYLYMKKNVFMVKANNLCDVVNETI